MRTYLYLDSKSKKLGLKYLKEKYIIFKDDDAGKDLPGLKRWVDIIIENDAKGSIGLIGKYLKDTNLVEYLNSLDTKKIEIFCHGYSHSYIPFVIRKIIGRNQIIPTEFDRNTKSHNNSLKQYNKLEKKLLKNKSVVFGPPGNIWNNNVIEPLVNNEYKMMFSWTKVGGGLFTIPLTRNLRHDSLKSFIEDYEKNKDELIYTLQFHHADLSDIQFKLIPDVINFLKKEEKRIFVTPSELLGICHENDELVSAMYLE